MAPGYQSSWGLGYWKKNYFSIHNISDIRCVGFLFTILQFSGHQVSVPLGYDTNYLEAVPTSLVKTSVLHDCPLSRCQSWVPDCHLYFWSISYKLRFPTSMAVSWGTGSKSPSSESQWGSALTSPLEAQQRGNFNEHPCTSHGYSHVPSTERAGKNAQLPVSPWNGFDCMLSQLLPKGQKLRSSVSATGAKDQVQGEQ